MQIANLENKRLALTGEAERRAERLRAIGDLAGVIDRIPDYLLRANPQAVNHQLRLLLDSVTVHEDGDLELHFS